MTHTHTLPPLFASCHFLGSVCCNRPDNLAAYILAIGQRLKNTQFYSFAFIRSVASLCWTLMSVFWIVAWLVCHNLLNMADSYLHLHAPSRALVVWLGSGFRIRIFFFGSGQKSYADPDPDPGGIRGRWLGVKGKNYFFFFLSLFHVSDDS